MSYLIYSLCRPREAYSALYCFWCTSTTYLMLCHICADDTNCFAHIRSTEDYDLLQSDIDKISDWSFENHLFLHNLKTYVLRIHPPPPKINPTEFTHSLKRNNVQTKPSGKDLGVYLSSDLSSSTNIEAILKRPTRLCI